MEVHFTPGEEAQLSQIATTAGADAEQLVRKAALRLLEDDARFGLPCARVWGQTDQGELVEKEEMDALVDRILRP